MAKKATASKEQLRPDGKYNNKLAGKFINCLMLQGKKSIAQRMFYDAMDIIAEKEKAAPPIEIFETAMNNVKPMIEVRSKRVGGASYQVPMQVNSKRQQSLAIRWVLDASRGAKGKPMCERLAAELIEAYHGKGGAMSMRENVHKMAEANKAFAHFAW
jgi:small subunit ribosomal protein S7